MSLKRIISIVLAICLLSSSAVAESTSFWGSVSDWFSQAVEDTSEWATQAWSDTSDWAEQAWDDTTEWAGQAWSDTTQWVSQAWNDASAWAVQAWADSSNWVSQAWTDSSTWATTNWDNFVIWIDTLVAGNPYTWINDMILTDGILAYDSFAELRSFLKEDPDLEQVHSRYDEKLAELSLLDSDKDILWNMLL